MIVFKMDQHGQVTLIIITTFLFRFIRVQGHLYDRAVLTAAPGTSVAAASSSSSSAAAAAEEGDDKEAAKGNFSLAGFSRLMLIDMCILAGDVHGIRCRCSITLPARAMLTYNCRLRLSAERARYRHNARPCSRALARQRPRSHHLHDVCGQEETQCATVSSSSSSSSSIIGLSHVVHLLHIQSATRPLDLPPPNRVRSPNGPHAAPHTPARESVCIVT